MSRIRQFFTHRYGLKDLKTQSLSSSTDKMHTDVDQNILDALTEIRISCIDSDFDHTTVLNPVVCVHLCNEETGQYFSKTTLDIHDHDDTLRQIDKKRTFPQCFGYVSPPKEVRCNPSLHDRSEENVSFIWDESIVMNGSYGHVLDGSSLFLFEVIDLRNTKFSQFDLDSNSANYNRVAWGFLKPLGKNGRCNVSNSLDTLQRCRVQLCKYQHDSIFVWRQAKQMDLCSQSNVPNVFLQYLRWSHINIVPTLNIEVGPIMINMSTKKEPPGLIESDGDEERLRNADDSNLVKDEDHGQKKSYSRKQNEKCIVPESLDQRIHNIGAVILKFSHVGDHLAIATKSHSIHIYDIHERKLMYSSCFHEDEITALEWSCGRSLHLCSASMDGTIVLHELDKVINQGSMMKGVPRVIFTYSSKFPTRLEFISFHLNNEHQKQKVEKSTYTSSLLISSCETSLRLWDTIEGVTKGEIGEMIEHHLVPITALSKDSSNGRIFSGDVSGCIIIWKPEIISTLESLCGNDYSILRRINYLYDANLKNGIQSLHFQSRSKKVLLVTTKRQRKEGEGNIFSYDFSTQKIQSFCFEARMRRNVFTDAIFSPDGNYAIGGTQSGRIIFMEASGVTIKVS